MTEHLPATPRVLVTYRQGTSSCRLPCRFVGRDHRGLVVEVEHVDPTTGARQLDARHLPDDWEPRIERELTDEEWEELLS